jgi:hypothetical protein
MQEPKKPRFRLNGDRTVRSRSTLIGIYKLSAGTVLYLFKVMEFNVFWCHNQGREIWNLESLRSYVNCSKKAKDVKLNYRNRYGQIERGNLLSMFLEFVKIYELEGRIKQ